MCLPCVFLCFCVFYVFVFLCFFTCFKDTSELTPDDLLRDPILDRYVPKKHSLGIQAERSASLHHEVSEVV